MRMTIGFLGLCCLVGLAACSDDGLSVQTPQNSTTAASTGGDTAPTTGNDESGPVSDTGGSGGSDGPPPDPTGESSTGPEMGSGTGTGGPATGTDTGTGTTGEASTGTTGEACMPLSDDPSFIGVDCMSDLDCPDGYECQPFEGFVFQLQCQILCTQTCECPLGLSCNPMMDKSGASWMQCG
ncbi:hypothetical protein [Paraliomyxa miuraensis]|uniref:hypothetical protein n=1 Tax=Paraliomyxa miuraensis TaxID=376150 RepID=UPI00224F808A|nr:hypothetical protein [Paraliomyxa miuraensis]